MFSARIRRPDEDRYFYHDVDRVVRVYPVGVGRLVSAQCETIAGNRALTLLGARSKPFEEEGKQTPLVLNPFGQYTDTVAREA